ncbi:MAG: 30S ribosomal protein S20 [Spirochaetes bacterium]|uniref:Small ribosomal subunit protein bS20 n=1 Tax=Candidatus Ornithospirochaeta stercoripullorum TaxID=2840899 RepID=A0A9D9E373_9SPIO|nr:30S ribosomal protein S20 [Candidatus Ornithospirochaeta stercoripullorum]
MANKSAEKRERQEARRRLRNRMAKSTMRTAIKKFDAAVAAGDKEAAVKALAESNKLLDTVAGKGIIHRNTAARKKSRLAHAYNKMV